MTRAACPSATFRRTPCGTLIGVALLDSTTNTDAYFTGRWVTGDRTTEVTEPATCETLSRVRRASAGDIGNATHRRGRAVRDTPRTDPG